jgi:high affinity Mn2+ porin
MRGGLLAGIALVALAGRAEAGDLPVKAPPAPAAYDWTGFYVGGHIGYAAGSTNWSATQTGAAVPALMGSLDLFNSFDAFKGTGSYFEGVQAGYNTMLPSRLLLGVEADASFPSNIAGTSVLSSAAVGSYSLWRTGIDGSPLATTLTNIAT